MNRGSLPPPAFALGFSGLLPQIAVVLILLLGGDDLRHTALATGFAFAALIYSFLGGVWWGLAARGESSTPGWVWGVAVLPSLVALATAWPWLVGGDWPGPSLIVLGIAIAGSIVVDWRLQIMGLTPAGWLTLRAPLSLGLGGLTFAAGLLA